SSPGFLRRCEKCGLPVCTAELSLGYDPDGRALGNQRSRPCRPRARLSRSTLTRGSPKMPANRPAVCRSMSAVTCASAMPLAFAACGRRTRVEILRVCEVLRDERRADDFAVAGDQRAVGPVAEGRLADAPDQERIEAAGDHKQSECDADGDEGVLFHASLRR